MLMVEQLLGNLKRGMVFVISAPAGTGKTTLVRKLTAEFPSVIQSISFATRAPREGEVDGIDYNFTTREDFRKRIDGGEFLEHVELYGDFYGTSRKWVAERLEKGKHVILVIDTQGARQLMGNYPAIFIFIRPPSTDVLKERIAGRSLDTPEAIQKRLSWAAQELEQAKYYQYQIVNDDLEIAYQVLRSIVIAEAHKVKEIK